MYPRLKLFLAKSFSTCCGFLQTGALRLALALEIAFDADAVFADFDILTLRNGFF